jgi:hypothetical protein
MSNPSNAAAQMKSLKMKDRLIPNPARITTSRFSHSFVLRAARTCFEFQVPLLPLPRMQLNFRERL